MKLHRFVKTFSFVPLTAAALTACGGPDESPQPPPPTAQQLEQLREQSDAFANVTVRELMADGAAMDVAGRLFAAQCASCHGPRGQGGRGVTDLTAGRFDYGATEQAIQVTIRDGRHSVMPSMGHSLGEVDLGQLVAYVQSLGTDAGPQPSTQHGADLFAEHCASCHGTDGRGLTDKGAPNLTDDYWQNGASMMNIRLAVTRGVDAQCPPHADTLSPTQIDLLTAFVLKLSGAHDGVSASGPN
jgi:cytochrome c oxidase cbb3-type subunit 3